MDDSCGLFPLGPDVLRVGLLGASTGVLGFVRPVCGRIQPEKSLITFFSFKTLFEVLWVLKSWRSAVRTQFESFIQFASKSG